MGARRNAAIYAGLMGSLALLAPCRASALSAGDVVSALDYAFASPSAAFAAGLAGGVVASAAVFGVVSLVSRARRRRASATGPSDGMSDAPGPQTTVPADSAEAVKALDGSGRVPAPSEGSQADDAERTPGRRGRHFRRDAAKAEPDEKAAADASPASEKDAATGAGTGQELAAGPEPATASEPSASPAPAEGRPARLGPTHAAVDYEDIALNYVRRISLRERMARRAQGVAATLRERMDTGKMDGVPVITRADGTVGDVGTSWWRATVGSGSIATDAGFADEEDLAIPSDFTNPSAPPVTGFAAQSIAERVARVDEEAYPERLPAGDPSEDEDWASALRSLDERFLIDAAAPEEVAFSDAVGGLDTLDEPDNLEPATEFIPFKPVAGHPEVVDTDSYVDHLIEEEFSKNTSKAVRRTSRRFLRVLQGGTGAPTRRLAGDDDTGTGYVGKHFAAAPRAAEA